MSAVAKNGGIEGAVIEVEIVDGSGDFAAVNTITGETMILKPCGAGLYVAYDESELRSAEAEGTDAIEISGCTLKPMEEILRKLNANAYAQALFARSVMPEAVPAELLRDVGGEIRATTEWRDAQAQESVKAGTVDPQRHARWNATTARYRTLIEEVERRVAA